MDKDDLGFGKRSWRYSMLVKDGVVEKMFIEPEKPGDPYEVSDADTMLDYINPNAKKPHDVVLFTRAGCPFCARAKGMLRERGMDFEEIEIGDAVSVRAVRAATGADSVPQVFIDGQLIGGSDQLSEWLSAREAA